MKQKLYYEIEHGNFYWVEETPKGFKIDWVEHLNCDGSKLDQNVKYENLLVKKDNTCKHCLKEYDEDSILIYPYQNGDPFRIVPAELRHIQQEIEDCHKWGVSDNYYRDLIKFL